MPSSTLKSSFNLALNLLKKGETFLALKELDKFRSGTTNHDDPDYLSATQNYILALNIIFDRNLAAIEELLSQNEENKTAIELINISDNFLELKDKSVNLDKSFEKKVDSIFKYFEVWTFKVLNDIKITLEKKKKELKKHFEEIISYFGIVSSLFVDHFIPIIEKTTHKSYNLGNFNKLKQSILLHFGDYIFNKIELLLQKKNIIEAHQLLKKSLYIQKLIQDNSKFNGNLINLQKRTAELAADNEMEQGIFSLEHKKYEEAAMNFRNSFNQYRILKIPSKQEKGKKLYLNTCILSAQADIKKAEEFALKNDYENAQSLFNTGLEKLKKINAKKEFDNAQNQLNNFQKRLGNKILNKASKISLDSLKNINKALNLYQDTKDYFIKADDSKKEKEINSTIIKISKIKMKLIEKEIQQAHKKKQFEKEFLFLEEMHLLCYEVETPVKAQTYAKQLEKLKPKVNFQKIKDMKNQQFLSKPWLAENENPQKTQIVNQNTSVDTTISNLSMGSPDIFNSLESNTVPFFNPSKIQNDKTYFADKIKFMPNASQTNEEKSEELKLAYQIIKKYNESKYLTNQDIQNLLAFSVNLPQDIYYYHNFSHSSHQFYVHNPKTNFPKVLMIPSRNLIKKKRILGSLVYKIDQFIPISAECMIPSDLLEEHIKFVINHPNWSSIMEGFQYSTLDTYFYFLHSIRLFSKKESTKIIAKYINSSIIAEYLNVTTEKLEKYLDNFKEVKFIEEILLWSDKPNFRLFFIGLFFFKLKKYKVAATIWSMQYIS